MNRGRNLICLGVGERVVRRDLVQRKVPDIFEHDPFKTQSFNFRYAEKPAYAPQNYVRREFPMSAPRCASPPRTKEIIKQAPLTETFYYNRNFSREQTDDNASSDFYMHRRRRILHNFQSINAMPLPAGTTTVAELFKRQNSVTVAPQLRRNNGEGVRNALRGTGNVSLKPTNSAQLRSCSKRSDSLDSLRTTSTTCQSKPLKLQTSQAVLHAPAGSRTSLNHAGAIRSRSSSLATGKPQQQHPRSVSQTPSGRGTQLESKRSCCSGCEININISTVEPGSEVDNVRIQIETDSCLLNNTDNAAKMQRSTSRSKSKSRDTFIIDKRLSKFSVASEPDSTQKLSNYARTHYNDPLVQERLQEQHRERLRAGLARERLLSGERHREVEAERQLARLREQARERLREIEREKDAQRLLELDMAREHDRLRELARARESRRRVREQSERLPMRPRVTHENVASPPATVIMQSHLYRPSSNDRLPGIMPFRLRSSESVNRPAVPPTSPQLSNPNVSRNGRRAQRLQSSMQNLQNLQRSKTEANIRPLEQRSSQVATNLNANRRKGNGTNAAARTLERRSSQVSTNTNENYEGIAKDAYATVRSVERRSSNGNNVAARNLERRSSRVSTNTNENDAGIANAAYATVRRVERSSSRGANNDNKGTANGKNAATNSNENVEATATLERRSSRVATNLHEDAESRASGSKAAARTLERRSSRVATNLNAKRETATAAASRSSSLKRAAKPPAKENQATKPAQMVTRINNLPIRITSSKTAERDVDFRQMRVRHDSPAMRRHSSQLRTQNSDINQTPYHVNINVYADNARMMRL